MLKWSQLVLDRLLIGAWILVCWINWNFKILKAPFNFLFSIRLFLNFLLAFMFSHPIIHNPILYPKSFPRYYSLYH